MNELSKVLGCISHFEVGTLKGVINSIVQSSVVLHMILAFPA